MPVRSNEQRNAGQRTMECTNMLNNRLDQLWQSDAAIRGCIAELRVSQFDGMYVVRSSFWIYDQNPAPRLSFCLGGEKRSRQFPLASAPQRICLGVERQQHFRV